MQAYCHGIILSTCIHAYIIHLPFTVHIQKRKKLDACMQAYCDGTILSTRDVKLCTTPCSMRHAWASSHNFSANRYRLECSYVCVCVLCVLLIRVYACVFSIVRVHAYVLNFRNVVMGLNVHICARKNAHQSTSVCTSMDVCMHVCTHTMCISVHINVCMCACALYAMDLLRVNYVHTFVMMLLCTRIYIHACTYACMHIYVRICMYLT